MLILTRRPDESIIIDGDIKIKILSVNGNQVRISFEAPSEVIIMREELLDIDERGD